MKLTRTERWVLANQYNLLSNVDKKNKEYYEHAVKVLEHGFELDYATLCQNIYDTESTMSSEECVEATNILAMFDNMRYCYEQLKDSSGIKKEDLNFLGFDGNDSKEVKYLSYSRFLCEDGGKFEKLSKGDFYNSHFPSLDMYRRMVSEYEKSESKARLTKEDIMRIIQAKTHPSRRKESSSS